MEAGITECGSVTLQTAPLRWLAFPTWSMERERSLDAMLTTTPRPVPVKGASGQGDSCGEKATYHRTTVTLAAWADGR